MSRRSNIELLPEIVRVHLDSALERHGWGNIEAIAADFRSRTWKISKSALHRYAQKRQRFMQAAAFEAQVLKNLDDDAAFLVRWARAEPKAAARLVKRLRAQQGKRT